MARFKNTTIGLDIGSDAIKFVELKRSGANIILSKLGIKEIPKDKNIDRAKLISQTISELFIEHRIKERLVNLSTTGQSVFIRFIKVLPSKEERLKTTMKFEAQNQIPFSFEEVHWDWSLVETSQPLRNKAVIAAVKKTIVEEQLGMLKDIRLSTEIIDVAPLCIYNCTAFNEDYDPEQITGLIDIGFKATNFVILFKNDVWTRSFPLAGERLKESGEQGLEELIGELERSLEYYHLQRDTGFSQQEGTQQKNKIDQILLMGGGTLMEALEEALIKRFDAKVRSIDPFRKLQISKEALSEVQRQGSKQLYAHAVGLALRAVTKCAIEINFLKTFLFERRIARAKKVYSTFSIFLVLVILGSLAFFVREDYRLKKLKLKKVEELTELYRSYQPKIARLGEENEILESKLKTLSSIGYNRGLFLDILNELNSQLSKELWITDISSILTFERDEPGKLDISGKALSYSAVNSFISSLKSSKYFREVKPISSSVEVDRLSEEEIVKFSISMEIERQ